MVFFLDTSLLLGAWFLLSSIFRLLPASIKYNMSIPTIDFSSFFSGNDQVRGKLADRLTEEFKLHGAARLVNTGITGESMPFYFQWLLLSSAKTYLLKLFIRSTNG